MEKMNKIGTYRTAGVRAKAQTMAEFVLFLALIAAVLTGVSSMTLYMRRGLMARYRAGVLRCVKATTPEHQYEPYYTREAYRDESQKGCIKTGWHTASVTDVRTDVSSWEHIPLPLRWSSSR